jgi:hypothetical protein
MTTDLTCPSFSTPIYAGQHILVGNLVVWNDNVNLYVKYDFDAEMTASEFHLWVGCDIGSIPNPPAPGQFEQNWNYENSGNDRTYTIPLSLIGGCIPPPYGCPNSPMNIYIVAHSAMSNPGGQTAFSYLGNPECGKTFEQQGIQRWGWVTCYSICCEPFNNQPPPETYSETAFAKPDKATPNGNNGGYIFASDNKANPDGYFNWDLTKMRWGWGGKFNISTSTFPMELPLWAGCGLNNTTNGVQVGTVTLSKSATQLIVTYNTISPFTFNEVHIYLGATKPSTIAPGQYGFTWSTITPDNNEQFTFDLPSGDFYFIGHAVAQLPVVTP